MNFKKTPIQDVVLIEPEKHEDDRGNFCRTFDKNQLFHQYIDFTIVQTSLSFNKKKGTLRGMHYQDTPYMEEKIVQCVKGSIYDVILDLRPYSKTYNKWHCFKLNENNNYLLYIPIEVAHGFQTLEDNTTVLYYMNQEYHSESAKTIQYNDKKYNIKFPLPITSISENDNINHI